MLQKPELSAGATGQLGYEGFTFAFFFLQQYYSALLSLC